MGINREMLKKNSSIKEMVFSEESFGREGIREIAEALNQSEQ
jgi:hypothetical protein